MAATLYWGTVLAIEEAGPRVQVPRLGGTASFGPLNTLVPNLADGERVLVGSLGDSRDQLVILGRSPGEVAGIDEIAGLREALDALLETDEGLDNRLTAAEGAAMTLAGRVLVNEGSIASQNTRLTAVETKNTAQDGRLTTLENASAANLTKDTAQDTRMTTIESAATALTTRVTNAETAATALTGRVSATEAKNTEQDTSIASQGSAIQTLQNQAVALGTAGSHIWFGNWTFGSATPPTRGVLTITSWATDRTSGIATIDGSGRLLLNRAGRWAITLRAESDASVQGVFGIGMTWTGGDFGNNEQTLTDRRWRGGGFSGAGNLYSSVVFVGNVAQANIAKPISCAMSWLATPAGNTVSVGVVTLTANYLGATF